MLYKLVNKFFGGENSHGEQSSLQWMNVCFVFYILVYVFSVYCFFSQIEYPSYVKFPECTKLSGDWKFLFQFNVDDFMKHFSVKNVFNYASIQLIIFNVLFLITNDYTVAMNWTPTILIVLTFILIYALESKQKSPVYGLFSVLLFSTFPITLYYTKYNIYHIEETLYILFCWYLFIKSESFKKIYYSILYLYCFGFLTFVPHSGSLYAVILLGITVCFFYREKDKNRVQRLFIYLSIFLIIYGLSFKAEYILIKLNHLFFNSSMISQSDLGCRLYEDINRFKEFLTPSIFYIAIFSVGFLCFSLKRSVNNLNVIVALFFVLIPFLVLYWTNSTLTDIFPVFCFIALTITNALYKLVSVLSGYCERYQFFQTHNRIIHHVKKMILGMVFTYSCLVVIVSNSLDPMPNMFYYFDYRLEPFSLSDRTASRKIDDLIYRLEQHFSNMEKVAPNDKVIFVNSLYNPGGNGNVDIFESIFYGNKMIYYYALPIPFEGECIPACLSYDTSVFLLRKNLMDRFQLKGTPRHFKIGSDDFYLYSCSNVL